MLINVRDIEEKLKKRPVGTVDWYKFFSVTIPLIETEEGLSMVFEVRAAAVSYTHLDVYKRQVEKVEDVMNIGDKVEVKVAEIDSQNRINLLRTSFPDEK